ncbi:hypothetical protein [Nocardia sp. XZ_19_369]|uniref:hypothetical protein n=1 Tax=Nocardia sp. XZ_19_369 TaxID=2769487 RepID=UPI00188EF865|nr:hypothetical protein [Nocardia sp. XZ_19_369]
MLHITSTEDGEASWQVVGQRISMESFTDFRSSAVAYRLRLDGSIVDIPNGGQGVVYFGEADERPDLPFVEERFPGHHDLWAAVEAAYWDVVAPLAYSRLDRLGRPALDYSTGEWSASELRGSSSYAGPSAQGRR